MIDMFSESRKHAAQIREFYDAYISAGFSHEAAFEMVKILLAGILPKVK